MFDRKNEMKKNLGTERKRDACIKHLPRYLYGVSLQNTRQPLQKHLTLDQIRADQQQGIINLFYKHKRNVRGKQHRL